MNRREAACPLTESGPVVELRVWIVFFFALLVFLPCRDTFQSAETSAMSKPEKSITDQYQNELSHVDDALHEKVRTSDCDFCFSRADAARAISGRRWRLGRRH